MSSQIIDKIYKAIEEIGCHNLLNLMGCLNKNLKNE